jgi:hypothetical protein
MSLPKHLRDPLFTQLWTLAQKDEAGAFRYYKGLTDEERQNLTDTFTDALEIERRAILGDRFPVADKVELIPMKKEEIVPATGDLGIHDPSLYSFGEKKLWIPFAQNAPSGPKRGTYAKKYPLGLVIHWTAGWRNGLKAGNDFMRTSGMLYLLGDKDGNLSQSDPLDRHGYHSGVSSRKGLSGYVSDDLAGVELQAAGTLREHGGHFYPWWDQNQKTKVWQNLPANRVPANEVIRTTRRGNIAPGNYHAYTEAQMLLLRRLVCWLYLNNPDVFRIEDVCGHDEVSPDRKTDPGGALHSSMIPMTMDQFRDLVRADIAKIQANRNKAA